MASADFKKATFNLDADLHQQLKVMAAVQRREMVDLLREALTNYFGWNRMTPTEHQEQRLYNLADSQGKGQRAHLDFIRITHELGGEHSTAAQLLVHVAATGRVLVDVWDGSAYRALNTFPDENCLYNNGGNVHLQLTIPGRVRCEQLQQRQAWEAARPE